MKKYKRNKFKSPKKYPGPRSIPLRNPAVVRWPANVGRPKPLTGPTLDCFDDRAKWYAFKEGQLVRITGEPPSEPKYVVVERRKHEVELRMYYVGTRYVFVQLHYSLGKLFKSLTYNGRDNAIWAYQHGEIRYCYSMVIAGES